MEQRPWFPSSPWTVAALVAAVALGVWAASRTAEVLGIGAPSAARPAAAAGSPARDPARSSLRGAPVLGQGSTVARTAPSGSFAFLEQRGSTVRPEPVEGRTTGPLGTGPEPSRAPESDAGAPAGDPGGDHPGASAERAEAERLAEALRRLVRDLEFNAGLPEPPQQVVARPPEPWRPPEGSGRAAQPVIVDVEPRSAPLAGGARVTIRGRNLHPTQVMFGQAPARIVSASGEAVSVEAPGGAGPVVIAVTNDDGTFALSGVPFTYRDARQ